MNKSKNIRATTKITNSKTKKKLSPTNKFYPKQTTWPFKKNLAK